MSQAQPLWLIAPLGILLGAVLGSFIANILVRWPKGESVLSGRSRCDSCRRPLGFLQLVPVLSFLALRGRCPGCGAAIDRRHLAIELASAGLALIAMLAHPLPLALITLLFGCWLLLLAALDLEQFWLPDRLTLPLVPVGLFVAWLGFGPPLHDRLVGALVAFVVLALIGWAYQRLRRRQGLGGGDPKLFAAIGAWVGALQLPYILIIAGLLGLAAIASMALRGEEIKATSRLPFGTLMALAAWPVWLIIA